MLTGLSCKRVNRAPLSLKLKKKGKKSKEGKMSTKEEKLFPLRPA